MHVQLVEAYWPIHWWSKTLWSVKGEANIVDLLLTRLHFKVVRSCIYSLFYVIWGSLTMLVRFHIKKQQFRSDRLFSILFLSLSAERSVFIGGAHSRLASECPLNEWCTYIALYCVLLYTQSASQSCGGGVSPQPPPVCSIHLDDATAATGQRHQCPYHTPATGGEERES